MIPRVFASCASAALLLLMAGVSGQTTREAPGALPESRPGSPESRRGPDLQQVRRLILDRVNDFRKQQGRGPLKENQALARTSEYFAGYMARTDKYGHDADGKQPAQRAAAQGYDYCIVLENIAWQFKSEEFTAQELAKNIFEGWRKSLEHRRNMLDADVAETGLAVAHSAGSGKYYAVQMFGRPKSDMIRFRISNQTESTIKYRLSSQEFSLKPRFTRSHGACRPPEVVLELPGQAAATQPGRSGTDKLRPRDGAHYIIRADKDGGYHVEVQQGRSGQQTRHAR